MRVLTDVDGNEGILIDVVVRDPVLCGLIEQHSISQEGGMDRRLSLVADVLEIGARMVQRQQDGAQADLLRREIEAFERSLISERNELVDLVGSNFAGAVNQVMTSVSEQLAVITGQLQGALAVADRERQVAEERERGTAKGREFEREVVDYVEHVAGILGDTCERTGDVGGIEGRAGDAVVAVGGAHGSPRAKIAFEAKTGRLSRPEAMRELDRVMQTRSADFAVLVVADRSRVPANTYELREYGGNKIVCVFDDVVGNAGLEMAYSLARARVLMQAREESGADVAAARTYVERAVQSLEMTRQVKLKMTAVKAAADESRNILDAMTDDVRMLLAMAAEALES